MSPLGGVDKATLRERRRFALRRLRGRVLAWRYLLIGLVLALVGGLSLWALEFHGFGRAFDLKNVDIVGASTLVTPDAIEKAAQLPVGQSLIEVNLDEIRVRVRNIDAVADADVSREWPDAVKIVVTLRKPVAAYNDGTHCSALDATGATFFSYPAAGFGCPKPLDVLPVVLGNGNSADQNAQKQAAGVAAGLPISLRNSVKYIKVASQDGITLVLKGDGKRRIPDGTEVTWGSAASTTLKAQVLADLIRCHPDAVAYNVSVPDAPAVTPKPGENPQNLVAPACRK